jgi:hypothetical protein
MAREYTFNGNFQITTTCTDLEKIAQALNETAKQFGDILHYNWQEDGYMFMISNLDVELPVTERIEGEEEEAEIEEE